MQCVLNKFSKYQFVTYFYSYMILRDFFWGKGGRCVRVTTYHPRRAERQENPGP